MLRQPDLQKFKVIIFYAASSSLQKSLKTTTWENTENNWLCVAHLQLINLKRNTYIFDSGNIMKEGEQAL